MGNGRRFPNLDRRFGSRYQPTWELGGAAAPATGHALFRETVDTLDNVVGAFYADQGVTLDTGKVSDWANQSGSLSSLAQDLADSRPTVVTTNSVSALRFDGTDDYLERENEDWINGTSNATLYIVAKLISATSSGQFFSPKVSYEIRQNAGTGQVQYRLGATSITDSGGGDRTGETMTLHIDKKSDSDHDGYTNNTLIGNSSSSYSGGSTDDVGVGMRFGGAGTAANIDVFAIIVTTDSLTSGERTSLYNAAVSAYGAGS